MPAPWKKTFDQPRQHIKKQRHYFADKGSSSQSYGFSGSHIWMWELDHKESWMLKNLCFWTVEVEKIPESPLDCKEIKPVYPKGKQSWIVIGRTDAEADISRCWERLKEGGEWDDRGWDVWMASPTQWTRVYTSSGTCWWTGQPGVLQSMGSQRIRHNWLTDPKTVYVFIVCSQVHCLCTLLWFSV